MTNESGETTSTDEMFLIRYDGGLADQGALGLDDYAASLAGWRAFITLTVRIALGSRPSTAHLVADRVLRLRVTTERNGSWETVVSIGLDIVPNALWDGIKWASPIVAVQAIRWAMQVAKRHAELKRETVDVDEIAAALERMVSEDGFTLSPTRAIEFQAELFPEEHPDDAVSEVEPYELKPDVPRRRAVVEAIDQALNEAVKPIGRSCVSIEVKPLVGKESYLLFDTDDKNAILTPLEVRPTRREWERAWIKFVRINKKTGRALFYFASDPAGEDNSHYSQIIDEVVHTAGNVYTEAFSKDSVLEVFIRHGPVERGSIRTVWQITLKPPDDALFS